ncbi:hypothetical protein TB2_036701 [Malus domestica]
MEYARINGLDLLTVCPTLVFGPILQYIANASTLVLIKLLKAEAVLMAYEKPEAEGRYICTAHIKARDLVEELRSIYPNKRTAKVELGETSEAGFEFPTCSWRNVDLALRTAPQGLMAF